MRRLVRESSEGLFFLSEMIRCLRIWGRILSFYCLVGCGLAFVRGSCYIVMKFRDGSGRRSRENIYLVKLGCLFFYFL